MSDPVGIAVDPNGQTLVVTITENGGGTPSAYTDPTGQTPIAMPATISALTTFYLADANTFTVSAKNNGVENANGAGGTALVDLSGGGVASLTVKALDRSEESNARQGFYGTTPIAKQTVPAAAIDAASTQALANSLRTALINLGLVQ